MVLVNFVRIPDGKLKLISKIIFLNHKICLVGFLLIINNKLLIFYFRAYIQRAFQACNNNEDKTRVENYLKTVITERMNDGTAFTIDWTKQPLPT